MDEVCTIPDCWCHRADQSDPSWPAFRWSPEIPESREEPAWTS